MALSSASMLLNKHIYFRTPCDKHVNNRLDYELNDHHIKGNYILCSNRATTGLSACEKN